VAMVHTARGDDSDFWAGKTVVVAGATGFLGGWLVRRLSERNARVIALVRGLEKPSQLVLESLIHRTTVERGRVDDPCVLERLFDRYTIDVFFHAAYGADVNRVLKEPVECFTSSALSTWMLLDLVRRRQPGCVTVISSTDKAYGSQPLPYRESSALTPLHPYEVAKASQDLAAQSFGRVYGVPVAITRCGNYFGPYDFNFSRLMPGVCESLAAGRRPHLRSDGRFTRDFLYIEDAADVQLLLAERLARDPSLYGQAFNFSYGEQLEVIDIVERITALAGLALQPVVADDVQAEIRHMHLSSDKARRLLDWHPRVGFDEGLRRTVDWYLSFLSQPYAQAGSRPARAVSSLACGWLHAGALGSAMDAALAMCSI
jgi:CDP-glucose 4,6-dehydratase